jgi:hypothetical protein
VSDSHAPTDASLATMYNDPVNPADRHPSARFPIVLARHRDGPALDKARVLAVNPWAERQLPAELRTLKSFEADRDRNPGETRFDKFRMPRSIARGSCGIPLLR